MIAGLILMLAGALILLFIIAGLVPSSYFSALSSYGISFIGFVIGLNGVVRWYETRVRREIL
jgi:hypothetical protein